MDHYKPLYVVMKYSRMDQVKIVEKLPLKNLKWYGLPWSIL